MITASSCLVKLVSLWEKGWNSRHVQALIWLLSTFIHHYYIDFFPPEGGIIIIFLACEHSHHWPSSNITLLLSTITIVYHHITNALSHIDIMLVYHQRYCNNVYGEAYFICSLTLRRYVEGLLNDVYNVSNTWKAAVGRRSYFLFLAGPSFLGITISCITENFHQ